MDARKKQNLRIFVICLLIGLGIGWWITRDRRGKEEEATVKDDSSAYADQETGFTDTSAHPGDIVVDFKDDVDPAHVAEVAKKLGLELKADSEWTSHDQIYVAHVDPSDEAADLDELRSDPTVEAAEENLTLSIPEDALDASDEAIPDTGKARAGREGGKFVPNDPRYGEQWHLDQIHMPDTWRAAQGDGVIVAVVDTGVSKVQDLKQTDFVAGWNFVNNTANTDDDHGHGTHVAGTIAQSTHNGVGVAGVAYHARIMPMKVLSAQGSGSVAGIADAIRWAADHGAKVMNMSLGGPMSSQVLKNAVKYAHDKGVTVVCAAGNDGRGKVSFPAAFPGAIAVAATQADETTTFYSNWGKEIDVAAPGGNTRGNPSGGVLQNTIYQGKDDYYFFMGTSMASPHVAGVAALIVGSGITDPNAVEAVLKETARKPKGLADADADVLKKGDYAERYGAGIVDAAAAVRKAQLETGAAELGVAAGLGALLLLGLRRRQLLAHFGVVGAASLLMASSGLFFLPQLGVSAPPIVTHGLPGWDAAIFGAASHGNPIFYSALVPVALGALLFSRKRLRGLIAGVSFGVAGHLVATALLRDVDIQWLSWDKTWLVANALVSVAIGYVSARKDD